MTTQLFTHKTITQAAALLLTGEVVAFPTETVYGLGAVAYGIRALRKVFKAKGRPLDNPFIVHIASVEQVHTITDDWTPAMHQLALCFWPGPLTIVSHRHPKLPSLISAGLETVAIRVPSHPLALELLALAGHPLVAPSANLSGRPSATTSAMVFHDLSGKIAGILTTQEKLSYGLESTVVSLHKEKKVLYILREGFITEDDLLGALPDFQVEINPTPQQKLSSPGTRYAHYQPSCPLALWQNPQDLNLPFGKTISILVWQHGQKLKRRLEQENWKIHISTQTETIYENNTGQNLWVREFSAIEDYACHYYQSLFVAEQKKSELILAQTCPNQGVGKALLNRLKRSSGKLP